MRQEYAELQWHCSDCHVINRPLQVICKECGKQRWSQLGVTRDVARCLATLIHDDGLRGVMPTSKAVAATVGQI